MDTTVRPGDPVLLTNNTSKTLTYKWANRPYNIPPGQTGYVPFELICLHFGDPRAISTPQRISLDDDTVMFIPTREAELHRIATLWGCYADNLSRLPNLLPDITVATTDGDILTPVAYDPTGEKIAQTSSVDLMDPVQLRAYLRKQQERMNILEEQLDVRTNTSITPPEDIEEDSPTIPNRRRTNVGGPRAAS